MPMPGYPIELDLRGRTVLVVGLGKVGRRRAAGLVEAGARVLGIDPTPWSGAPAVVEVRTEPYRVEHLQGVLLAIAAAPPEVNRRVVDDARRAGLWVNSASRPSEGDFTIPAVWRDGPLLVTISTGGASPALAAHLRDVAAEALGPAASGLAALLAELRPAVLARFPEITDRRRILTHLADPRWLELWRTEGPEAVRRQLNRTIEAGPGADSPER